MRTKDYESYQSYLEHQASKTLDPERRKKWLGPEWELKLKGFTDIFTEHLEHLQGAKDCLCLASRTGQEVQAFRDMGFHAIGIDIVPHEPLVLKGDFHDIPFEASSFDFVFCNAVDHVLKLEDFASEVDRVMRPNGCALFQLHFVDTYDEYTATIFDSPDELLSLFPNMTVLVNREIPKNFASMNYEIVLKKS